MDSAKAFIRPYRSDGKLGVDFDSPETLAKFLAFLIEENEPQNQYLVPVLENGGIVPIDDPTFQALLQRMGVTEQTLPNTLRSLFLVKFQKLERSHDMNLGWFEKINSEEQDLFIRHWELQCQRGRVPQHKLRFVADVCLPILRAIRSGDGLTDECLSLVQLAEGRDFSRSEIEPTIRNAYENFSKPMDTKQSAKYLGISQRHCRRLIAHHMSKLNNGDVRKLKCGWRVPVVVLDDWLLEQQRVNI